MPQDADKTEGEILPIPDQPYRGPVHFDARDASAPQQPMLRAPNGPLEVVIVRIDDLGFGILSALSGCVDMPTKGRLAKAGLRYPRKHFKESFLRAYFEGLAQCARHFASLTPTSGSSPESAPEFHGKMREGGEIL
jgi:hypothetical protein